MFSGAELVLEGFFFEGRKIVRGRAFLVAQRAEPVFRCRFRRLIEWFWLALRALVDHPGRCLSSGSVRLGSRPVKRREIRLRRFGHSRLDRLSEEEHAKLIDRIRQTRPDLLLVAFGQPKGELWLAENVDALGVPACVQLGASFDFVAGTVRRAPRWMQRVGGEWLYRISREPSRMIPRYFHDAVFMVKSIFRDAFRPAG